MGSCGQGNLQGANTIIITGDISEPDLFESDFFVNVNYSRGDDFIRYLNGGPNKIYNLDYHLYANTIACDGSANGQEGVAVVLWSVLMLKLNNLKILFMFCNWIWRP